MASSKAAFMTLQINLAGQKFLDAGIQDVSTSISIKLSILKKMHELTERCDRNGDESDKHI